MNIFWDWNEKTCVKKDMRGTNLDPALPSWPVTSFVYILAIPLYGQPLVLDNPKNTHLVTAINQTYISWLYINI